MTTQSPATCPRCESTKPSIFVRDGAWTEGVDNLVCLSESCRGEASHSLLAAGLVTA